MNDNKYDVIVVGGGHSGVEAAMAAARLKCKTLLITHNIDTLGQMSCNPAIGGIGKGHLVKEVDALGGIMAKVIDRAGIQFRVLNRRKGAAVRATRAQADRDLYKLWVKKYLQRQENLTIFQQGVDDLIVENDKVTGIVSQSGIKFFSKAVVLTVGTFLGGKIHIGKETSTGGRAGDPASIGLAQKLRALPFRVDRLKTGTPPRILKNSIDYSKLQEQPGDYPQPSFSFWKNRDGIARQVCCYITNTNVKTHDIIEKNLDKSAMYSGAIEGIGPRYCPSIEDKIVRFSSKNSHQIFLEPEGLDSFEVYPNGVSTSLPFSVQQEFIQSMLGMEEAVITRPGYAIEYDFFDPRDLKSTLETKYIKSLYFAGQINGTTGYEEAAAQGIIAGINSALKAQEKEEFIITRSEGYIGVLIDDLITLGTKEPYRMFTSRAEYRLILREDNAVFRLTRRARELGLINDFDWQEFCEVEDGVERESKRLKLLNGLDLLKRPDVSYADLMQNEKYLPEVADSRVSEQVEIRQRYSGYIDKQEKEIQKRKKGENKKIPSTFSYKGIPGLSLEVAEKLEKQRPETIGQASRISGVTEAAISLLLVYLKKVSSS